MKAAQVKLYNQKLSSTDPHLLIIGELMLFSNHYMLNYSLNIPNILQIFPIIMEQFWNAK